MNLNSKRLIGGVVVIGGGTLFCFFNARPEFREAVTFIYAFASFSATIVQFVINGSHIE